MARSCKMTFEVFPLVTITEFSKTDSIGVSNYVVTSDFKTDEFVFCSLPRSDVKSMLVYYFRDIHKETIQLLCRRFTLFIGPRRRAGAMNLVGVILLFSSGKWKLWGTHKLVAVPVGVGWDEPMMGGKNPAVVRVHVRVRQSKTLHFPVARRSPGIQPEFGNGVAG